MQQTPRFEGLRQNDLVFRRESRARSKQLEKLNQMFVKQAFMHDKAYILVFISDSGMTGRHTVFTSVNNLIICCQRDCK